MTRNENQPIPYQTPAPPAARGRGRPPVHPPETRAQVLDFAAAAFAAGETKRAAVEAAAARYGVPYSTISRWLTADSFDAGLRRRGGVPVVLSRALDGHLRSRGAEGELANLRAWAEAAIKAEFAKRAVSAPKCARNVRPRLFARVVELTGPPRDPADARRLRELCLLPAHLVRRYQGWAKIHSQRNDAGRWYDRFEPTVRRDWSGLQPMECVACDVTPLDLLVRRGDGTAGTPRMVAWMDLATRRVFYSVHLPAAGEGIGRREVMESLIAMLADPRYGCAGRYYLDNGGEYGAMEDMESVAALARTARRLEAAAEEGRPVPALPPPANASGGMVRSRPHDPRGKVIEGLFANLETTILSQFEGWIGGDRTRQRTQAKGRDPIPFPGTLEEFEAALAEAVRYYHNTPQEGHLRGRSPNDALREAAAAGWTSRPFDPADADVAIKAREETRRVQAGRVDWYGTAYYGDHLLRWEVRQHRGSSTKPVNPSVTVRETLLEGRVYAMDGDEVICRLWPDPLAAVDAFDPHGVAERDRRSELQRAELRAMEAEALPDAPDTAEVMRQVNALEGPEPDVPAGPPIRVSERHRAAAAETDPWGRDAAGLPPAPAGRREVGGSFAAWLDLADERKAGGA